MSESPGVLGTQQDVILPRVGAFIVDYFVSFIVAVAAGLLVIVTLESEPLMYLGVVGSLIGYFVVLEGWRGQTLGKWIFRVVVVSTDGSPITFRQSLARNVLRIIDGFFNYVVGLIVMLVSEDRQRIGDMVADTVVVRTRRL